MNNMRDAVLKMLNLASRKAVRSSGFRGLSGRTRCFRRTIEPRRHARVMNAITRTAHPKPMDLTIGLKMAGNTAAPIAMFSHEYDIKGQNIVPTPLPVAAIHATTGLLVVNYVLVTATFEINKQAIPSPVQTPSDRNME